MKSAQEQYEVLQEKYNTVLKKELHLNMARGKPSKEQLDLSESLLTVLGKAADCKDDNIDVRNYGELMGIPSARVYFADLLSVRPGNIFVGGGSSLQLMFDLIAKAWIWGLKDSHRPWCKEQTVKWLCPAPGYDRHFNITDAFGISMITVPITENGPDMDAVEKLICDPEVKGIWCVPKFSNPEGIIYSTETISRFCALQPAAPDFTVIWDNAYCVHEFTDKYIPFPSILSEAKKTKIFHYPLQCLI